MFNNDPLSLVGKIPGVFPVNKPEGMTSHDAVAIMRRKLNMKRVGHGGTLDPLATGLLLIFAGNATRLFDATQDYDKEYIAGFELGRRTDTQDITGAVIDSVSKDALPVTRERVLGALEDFRGDILQTPPMYSAIKHEGKRLYDLARQGVEIRREPRAVTVHELELLEFDGRVGKLRMAVSKGFYVRTLIDELGVKLETFATMNSLERTRIGPFALSMAQVLENRPKEQRQRTEK